MSELFSTDNVRTVGISVGGRAGGDVAVDYVPEAGGNITAQRFIDAWENTFKEETEDMNRKAAGIMAISRPVLTDIKRASECVPGMRDGLILHSGPPASYRELGDGLQKAIAAAVVYEGWARDPGAAEELLETEKIRTDSADEHSASAARCGVISPSMPVFRICDRNTGCYIYAPAAVYGDEKISDGSCSDRAVRNMWFAEDNLVPALSEALVSHGNIDIFSIAGEGMSSGDDLVLRTQHSASVFRDLIIREAVSHGTKITEELLEYLGKPQLFLEIFAAAVKAVLASAARAEGCSFITSLCSNGRKVGIRIAGKSDRWFTADLEKDVICGDEIVSELAGAGSAALCAAPEAAQRTGLGLNELLRLMHESYAACDRYLEGLRIPYSGYNGTPLFVDFIKMCRTSCPIRVLYDNDGAYTVKNIGLSLQIEALKAFVSER